MIWWEIANTIRLSYHISTETSCVPLTALSELGKYLAFSEPATLVSKGARVGQEDV